MSAKEKRQCRGKRFDGWHWFNCAINANHEHEGRWYCKTHHPPSVDAKTVARKARWALEAAERRHGRDVVQARDRVVEAAKAWVGGMTHGSTYALVDATEDLLALEAGKTVIEEER